MRLALTFVLFAATTQFPSGIAQADEKPNFSGTWKAEADLPAKPPRSGPRLAGLGSGWGVCFTISQTPELLEVERDLLAPGDRQPKIIFRYSLTGDQRTNTLLMGHGTHTEVSTARWEGNKLLITTIQSFRHPDSGENVRYEVKHVLSLENPQADAISPVLVIETTRAGVLGGAASNTRTVFHKERTQDAVLGEQSAGDILLARSSDFSFTAVGSCLHNPNSWPETQSSSGSLIRRPIIGTDGCPM